MNPTRRLHSPRRPVALEVLRHHRLLELYLHKKLNLPWDQVHAEAERLEHFISEALEDAIAAALDDPTIDPHGDPIPTKDGRVEAVAGIALTVAEVNHPYRLVRVLMQDPDRLTYLGSLGLIPGATIIPRKPRPFPARCWWKSRASITRWRMTWPKC